MNRQTNCELYYITNNLAKERIQPTFVAASILYSPMKFAIFVDVNSSQLSKRLASHQTGCVRQFHGKNKSNSGLLLSSRGFRGLLGGLDEVWPLTHNPISLS
jgi:hypothetical protein